MGRETCNHIVFEVQWNFDENVIYTVLFCVAGRGRPGYWGELKMNRFSAGFPSFFLHLLLFVPLLYFSEMVFV